MKIGMNCILYIDVDDDYADPTFEQVENCRDLTLNIERTEADMSRRGGGGYEEVVFTLAKASIEFDMVYDPTDTKFQAIRDAFLNNTPLPMFVGDGDVETEGTEGLRAMMGVGKFNTPQTLTTGCITSVSMKPYPSAHPPEYVAVDSEGALVSVTA